MEKQLLRPTEVADALGLGRSKVYQLIMTGAIESCTVGRSRRIPRSAVLEFVSRLRGEAPDEDVRAGDQSR